jgi:hypothetical protein
VFFQVSGGNGFGVWQQWEVYKEYVFEVTGGSGIEV